MDDEGIILADIYVNNKVSDYIGDRGKIYYNELFFKKLIEKNHFIILDEITKENNERILYKIQKE